MFRRLCIVGCLFISARLAAEVSDVLHGIAANVGAATPMVIAGIQSSADKAIARAQSKTSIEVTQIEADTTRYLADLQSQTTFSQIISALNINQLNQAATSERLMLQLRELSTARKEKLELERENMYQELALNMQRIALAQTQAEESQKLARFIFSAQLVQAGLAPAFALASTADRLAVTRVLASDLPPPNYRSAFQGRGWSLSAIPQELQGSSRARPVLTAGERAARPGAIYLGIRAHRGRSGRLSKNAGPTHTAKTD